MKNYKNRENQIYEEYWKYTAALTNIHNPKFINGLKLIMNWIDEGKFSNYSQRKYSLIQKELQSKIFKHSGEGSLASVRKFINQLVKIGFLNYKFQSYHHNVSDFIKANSEHHRNYWLTNIAFDNNSINGSVTKRDISEVNKLSFLAKTLDLKQSFDEDDLAGIMISNPDDYSKGYLELNELEILKSRAIGINFRERKYNQIGHLKQLIKIVFTEYVDYSNLIITRKYDPSEDFEKLNSKKNDPRSPIEQENFKNLLIEETIKIKGHPSDRRRFFCMLTGFDLPKHKLTAGHIWPYSKCEDYAKFDINNGLLIDSNFEQFFDTGEISFDDNGKALLPSNRVLKISKEWQNRFKNEQIDVGYLNSERKRYLKIHRILNKFENIKEGDLEKLIANPFVVL
tara:strand:- start:1073 stop:2266 length:1194 start_codon:yes stop_codon:yes gene_type:complete